MTMGKSEEMLRQLQDFECPFTWKIPHESSENTLEGAELKADQDRREKGRIQESAVAMILCYEYAIRGKLNKAFTVWKEWDSNYLKTTFDAQYESTVIEFENSEIFARSEAHRHVRYACKCFLLLKAEMFSEVKDNVTKITPLKNMSKTDQALVFWLQSDMIKDYGYSGLTEAIQCAEKALQLSPQLVILHYQMGRLLARHRRMERTDMCEFKEISFLEFAVHKSMDPKMMMMLAQSYQDKATGLHFSAKCLKEKQQIEILTQEALQLYRNILKNPERPVSVNIRCANGLMKLPWPMRDLNIIKDCIEKALAVRPDDRMLNHTAGQYYKMAKDFKKAKHHLMIATDNMRVHYAASMDLIEIKKRENASYNPVPDLEKLLTWIKPQPYIEDILCTLGACYFFKRETNFKKALEFWSQVIERNMNSKKLENFFNRAINLYPAINIKKITVTEIQKLIEEGKCSENEKQIYNKLVTSFPNLLED